MAVDVWAVLRSGGRAAIDLLEYSIVSVQLEPLFGCLAADYQIHPTARRALGLYDVFCAPGALGRIHAEVSLPPLNLRLPQEIQRIRENLQHVAQYNATQPEVPMTVAIPAKYLFDAVIAAVTSDEHEVVRRIRETYDPALEPLENLPGGKMTAGQRMFVERVWRPQLQPHLVQAGFPRVASIGG